MEKAFEVVTLNELPCPDVPHQDCATAVLTLWDDSLKVQIVDRMIFSRHGQAPFPERKWHAFRYGPRTQHIVHLEPEVVVQMAGSVFLDHEASAASLLTTARHFCRRWFRC